MRLVVKVHTSEQVLRLCILLGLCLLRLLRDVHSSENICRLLLSLLRRLIVWSVHEIEGVFRLWWRLESLRLRLLLLLRHVVRLVNETKWGLVILLWLINLHSTKHIWLLSLSLSLLLRLIHETKSVLLLRLLLIRIISKKIHKTCRSLITLSLLLRRLLLLSLNLWLSGCFEVLSISRFRCWHKPSWCWFHWFRARGLFLLLFFLLFFLSLFLNLFGSDLLLFLFGCVGVITVVFGDTTWVRRVTVLSWLLFLLLFIGLGGNALILGVRIVSVAAKLILVVVTHLVYIFRTEASVFLSGVLSRSRCCWSHWLVVHTTSRAPHLPLVRTARVRKSHELLSGWFREFSLVLELSWLIDQLDQPVSFISELDSLLYSLLIFKFEISELSEFVAIIFDILHNSGGSIFHQVIHDMDWLRNPFPFLRFALKLFPKVLHYDLVVIPRQTSKINIKK